MSTPAPVVPAAPAAPTPGGAPKPGEATKPGAAPEPPKGGTEGAPKPQDAAKPGETAAQAAARKKKYQVDGAEVEVDLGDEKSLDVLIQKGLAADKRFTAAAKYKKDSEMLLNLLQRDPMAVLERVAKMGGGDPRKIVEKWLYDNHVQLESMSEEDRQRELERRELEQRRGADKKREEEAKAARLEEAKAAYRGHFEKDIMGALQESGLPKTPRTVERMAHYLMEARKIGVKLGARDVAPLVLSDYEQEFRQLMGPMNGDVLANLLGDDVLKKIRERDLAKMRAQGNQPPAPPANQPPAAPPKEKPKLSMDAWREDLDRRVPLKK